MVDSDVLALPVPEDDASPSQVIGRKLNDDTVGRDDTDVVLPHLATDGRQYLVTVCQFHSEHRIRQGFDNRPLKFEDAFLFRHYSQSFDFSECMRQ